MRYYYEGLDISGNFIRMDITDKNSTDKDKILTAIKNQFSGKVYTLTYHLCGHEDEISCQSSSLN